MCKNSQRNTKKRKKNEKGQAHCLLRLKTYYEAFLTKLANRKPQQRSGTESQYLRERWHFQSLGPRWNFNKQCEDNW
jgi:hypothetical protein